MGFSGNQQHFLIGRNKSIDRSIDREERDTHTE